MDDHGLTIILPIGIRWITLSWLMEVISRVDRAVTCGQDNRSNIDIVNKSADYSARGEIWSTGVTVVMVVPGDTKILLSTHII